MEMPKTVTPNLTSNSDSSSFIYPNVDVFPMPYGHFVNNNSNLIFPGYPGPEIFPSGPGKIWPARPDAEKSRPAGRTRKVSARTRKNLRPPARPYPENSLPARPDPENSLPARPDPDVFRVSGWPAGPEDIPAYDHYDMS